jgi:metal-sulfur cluster biosynthetic enzyme
MTMSPTTASALPGESEIREALRYVIDPEVGVNIVDLGLVYRVDVTPEMLEIDIAPTSPACPMGEAILDEAREVVDALVPADMVVNIKLVWEPPWAPAMMTEAARRVLGWSDE